MRTGPFFSVIIMLGIALEKVAESNATCTTTGVKEHWRCTICDQLFTDSEGKNAITTEDLILPLAPHNWKEADCTTPKTCVVCAATEGEALGHSFQWIVDKEATKTEKGSKHEECTVCGYKNEAVEIPTITVKAPKIIEGDGQKVTVGQSKKLTFRSDADFATFVRVEVDGVALAADKYTVKSGSTVVELKADYVATLKVGEHTLGVVSQDGTAVAKFTVVEKKASDKTTKTPQTGDASNGRSIM